MPSTDAVEYLAGGEPGAFGLSACTDAVARRQKPLLLAIAFLNDDIRLEEHALGQVFDGNQFLHRIISRLPVKAPERPVVGAAFLE